MSDTWQSPLMRTVSDRGGMRALGGLLRMMRLDELVIPEYQRGRVWTTDQQSAWVGFVLSRMPLPAVWIRQVNVYDGSTEFRDELLDGQQRMTALLAWWSGDIPAVIPWSGEVAWCRSRRDQRALERCATPCMELPPTTTDAEAVSLYLTINTAGVQHTPEELNKARAWLAAKETT